MGWSSIIGQDRVKSILRKILQSNKIAHAYLFYGPEGVGKDALSIEFAKALICPNSKDEACGRCNDCYRMETLQHPNLNLIYALPVGKDEKTGDHPINVLKESQIEEIKTSIQKKARDPYYKIEIDKANFIKINSIRNIKREASITKVEKGKKIFIILNAEMMNAEASNSLLKTLEEPLPDTILLLTTSAKDQLLPTIISRCQLIKCDMLSETEIGNALISRDGIEPQKAHLIAKIANGNYTNARNLCEMNILEERNLIIEFLRLVLGKNKSAIVDGIEELVSTNDKLEIVRWLKILQAWIREALLLQQNSNIVSLMDDERQSMRNFVTKFPNANLVDSIKTIEEAIAHIDKNVYLSVILINLAIELRKNILGISII